MNFRVCGETELGKNLPWADYVVSIWSPGFRHELPEFPQADKYICRVDFDDITYQHGFRTLSGEMMIPPDSEYVASVLQFVKKIPEQKNVLFHCQAGISRSAAAAFLALCSRHPDENPKRMIVKVWRQRRACYPNELMVEYGDRLLHRNGELIKSLKWFQEFQQLRMMSWAKEDTFEETTQ